MSDETDAATAERGVLALINARGYVTAAASFRLGDPEDLNRAVQFINECRMSSDHVTRYVDGEDVRLSERAPARRTPGYDGDCDLCDGWHPMGDHGSSNQPPSDGTP